MVFKVIIVLVVLGLFVYVMKLKKDLRERTFLFWEEDGNGNKVLKNSKGEEIFKL